MEKAFREFTICAVHLSSSCSESVRKVLKDDWYILNGDYQLDNQRRKLVRSHRKNLTGFFGAGISVSAIVGMNGSGKSSLLELIYRIVNNLGCLLIRGKRRRAAERMYFVDGIRAELYFSVDGKLGVISCLEDEVSFGYEGGNMIALHAFDGIRPSTETVLMEDFISWAKDTLFYTIVTNYSMQAFCSQDYMEEPCFILDKKRGKQPVEESVWIDGLFHKNDGYMSPIVLNPYRDGGTIDMVKEHKLTKYRLSAAMIYAERKGRDFMKDYRLDKIVYQFDKSEIDKKFLERARVKENIYWNYKPGRSPRVDFGTAILSAYGVHRLNLSDTVCRTAAMYLIYKTYSIANNYPSYDEYARIGNVSQFTEDTNSDTALLVCNLVHRINMDKSHITLKIRQTLHFIKALMAGMVDTQRLLTDTIDYYEYVKMVAPDEKLTSMSNIQEYLPPSFFTIDIRLNHYKDDRRTNESPISLNRLSSGERQYLYTFSTYIYHILNLLSIQESNRVRYRRFNLVFDEVEICFHPEYQRRFVDELLGYIRRMRMNSHATYNIIIATHSPFILTDIPQSNILYLEEGKSADRVNFKNPFAANICDVLYQSFFLREGFVGEFARNKIREVLSWLNVEGRVVITEKRWLQFVTIMEQVGDPFVRMQLKQLLEKKTGVWYEETDNR